MVGSDSAVSEFVVHISENNGRLETDRCVWCGDYGKLTRSHLVPEVCGSRFSPFISCAACNNFLGSKVEADIKKNGFIQAALSKLGHQSKQDAYRGASGITDTATGAEMYIGKGGKAVVVPKELENGFRGTPAQMKEYHVAQLKKKHPELPAEPLEKFFDNPEASQFSYGETTYIKNMHDEEKTMVKIEAERDLSPQLIFKMAYEFLVIAGFMSHPSFNRLLRGYISIDQMDARNRIVIADSIKAHTLGNTGNTFGSYKELEEIPFFDAHYFVLRLSMNSVLYLEVTLFGQLRCFFLLGRWPSERDELNWWFDKAFFASSSRLAMSMENYDTITGKDHIVWADAAVECRLFELEKRDGKK